MEHDIFLELAEKYKDTVFRIALNYSGNYYDADDIVQDVFMKLYLTNKKFASDDHAKYWLIRVTINTCKDLLKSSWKTKNVVLDDIAVTQTPTFEKREQEDLYLTVMGLPEKYRTVLYLFYYEDFSVKEIAKMLKVKESAVTTRLSRGRNLLKEVFKNE
ncbi:sigma-70 family RNA polymerase sigma factor [Anaerocolumna sp. AGMB13025]|uniref:RNA polymerase sigma factor n=1 Tax=Anaerocolumna sp. AGMB13025 TaxID=3039116 RepID=UPI00241D745C|nr:sigma-70 family RNA polymerase sigma factor [Anaerocolumna sp. AGMB13025]WFR59033.1 sigma-70 family RNA polymerase sigma factor [Anaerocolumna sp. AGMB13025]